MSKQYRPYEHSDGKTWDHYFVRNDSGFIYFIKRHGGKVVFFSTKQKFPNGILAKRYANTEFNRRVGTVKVKGVSLLKDHLDTFLKFKESQGWAEDTMNNIRRAMVQIREFWGDRFVSEINRDTFADWCLWWKEHHPDIQMENAIKYLNALCVYLNEKVVDDKPVLGARLRFQDPNQKSIRASRAIKKERVFSHDDFIKIYRTAGNEVEALVVLIMYTMATRVDETLKLDSDRIQLDSELPLYRWTVSNNKAGHVGEHALHTSLIESLKALRDRRKVEGTKLFFPQMNDNQKPLREQQIDWSAWRDRAGLEYHWTPHTFRHTSLTNLFNDPKNPQAIICKQYRVSLQVALQTYIKTTNEAMIAMRDSIKVEIESLKRV